DYILNYFENTLLKDSLKTSQGMKTLNNDRFIRNWTEIDFDNSSLICYDNDKKWYPINHGGDFCKWYGNNDEVINWEDDGYEVKKLAKSKYNSVTRTVTGMSYYFKEGITWTAISSGNFSARKFPKGFLFSNAGMCAFGEYDKLIYNLGLLNSIIGFEYLKILSPTLNFGPNQVKRIPVIYNNVNIVIKLVEECIYISQIYVDNIEYSYNFKSNILLTDSNLNLQSAIEKYEVTWKNNFIKLHKNEEELNRIFLEIYNLSDRFSYKIPLGMITLLKYELLPRKQKGSKKKSSEFEEEDTKWTPVWENLENQFRANGYEGLELPFNHEEIIKQFISYAVGCMFGRYSLDQEGLILANQGDTLQQ